MRKKQLNEQFRRMQKLAGIITENQMNETPGNDVEKIKKAIQQQYPEVIKDRQVETGTPEWIDLLELVFNDVYGIKYFNPYEIFVSGEDEDYLPYKNLIKKEFSTTYPVTDMKSFVEEFNYSDMVNSIAYDIAQMDGFKGSFDDLIANDTLNRKMNLLAYKVLLQYAVSELNDYSYANDLTQALEELGVEVI
jgi:hypothetical protein